MKRHIPSAFLIFALVVVAGEAGIRSVAGKEFFLKWAEYRERQDWFAELRTQSALEEKRAETGGSNGVCVVGTSSTASLMQKTQALQKASGFQFYDLSNTLSGGESLLLTLAKTSFLPQKNVIFCVSEFSWNQPFDADAFLDLISLPISPTLLRLAFTDPQMLNHALYRVLLKGLCYDFVQSARYARELKFSVRNFFAVHFLGASLTSAKEIDARFETVRDKMQATELFQATRLTGNTDSFKQRYFVQILRELRLKQKKVFILRMRYHSRLEQEISPSFRKSFDQFLSDCCQQYALTCIDMNGGLSVNDSDFWDYTHFNETGARKIMNQLTARLQNAD